MTTVTKDRQTPSRKSFNNNARVKSLHCRGNAGLLLATYADETNLTIDQFYWPAPAGPVSRCNPANAKVIHELRHPAQGLRWRHAAGQGNLILEYAWRRAGALLDNLIQVSNPGTTPVDICLELHIRGLPLPGMCFAPAQQSDFDLSAGDVAFAYRSAPGMDGGKCYNKLSIPMACFYDRQRGAGFTVAGHIDAPTPAFACETNGETVIVRRRISVNPGGTAAVRQYIIRHAGCWRPGLGWIRDRYPEYFMLNTDAMAKTHGCFVYTNTATEALCDEFAAQGVKNVEIHWNCPFFGKVVPEEEPWIKMLDDKWNAVKLTTDPKAPPEDAPWREIKRYMSTAVKPSGRHADVRAFIRRLQQRGMRAYMYFNPTESWEFFAADEFPECIRRNPDKSPITTWFDHVEMDCRPESRWGQYLLNEVGNLLALYPEADGIFMDQSAADRDDFSIFRITHAVGKLAERAGKACYWNRPYMVDLLKHATGLLGECGPVQGESIKWLTIGNKVCCGLEHSEQQYQRNLLNGQWPGAPSRLHARSFRLSDTDARPLPIPEALMRLHGQYMPLYRQYPGKTWFLGPNPLDLPAGVQGNIFHATSGDYLIPLIVPGHYIEDGIFMNAANITIRIPAAAKIRMAYAQPVNQSDHSYKLPLRRRGNQLKITLPWLGSACLLTLSREAGTAGVMPDAPPVRQITRRHARRVICVRVLAEGVCRTGNDDGALNGLKTSAPLPPIPRRKVYLNGREFGILDTRNSRHWHSADVGVLHEITGDITDVLQLKNELMIMPDSPRDFFKIRNIRLLLVFADGQAIYSNANRHTYSSCLDPESEGIVQTPMKINIEFPYLPK